MKTLKRFPLLVAVMIVTASCWSANVAGPTSSATPTSVAPTPSAPPRVHSTVDDLTFPRTATYFLTQHDLPPVDQLARYDLIVLDNDWANRVPRSFFDDLRARNPRVKLLAYVNVVDQAKDIGTYDYWANGYKMWQLDPKTRESHFPDQWLARTAAGKPVHEWQDRVMTNLTDQAPRVNGQLFVEYAADWIVNTVWSSGIWDGIFLDVWGDHIWSADADAWDVDRNGVNETDDQIYGPNGPWARGLAIGERRLRAALPNAILVANGDRTLVGGGLNGRAFESFADPSQQERASDVDGYVDAASGGGMALPPTSMTINSDAAGASSPAGLRRARYELGATLLQNGYWAPMGADYGRIAYFDELDGAGRGRGYLGRPLQPNPTMDVLEVPSTTGTGSPADGVYRRDFDNGIVIVNTSGKRVTVPLERAYTRLKGAQDPTVNDGSQVTSVTIAPRDATVLVR